MQTHQQQRGTTAPSSLLYSEQSETESGGSQQQGLTRGTRRPKARRPSQWATSHCSPTGKPHLSIQRTPAQICQGPRRCAVLSDLGRLVEFAEATGADHPPWTSSDHADLPPRVLSGVPQPGVAGRPSLRWSWRRGRASRLGADSGRGRRRERGRWPWGRSDGQRSRGWRAGRA